LRGRLPDKLILVPEFESVNRIPGTRHFCRNE
jgi:hypothetical protein